MIDIDEAYQVLFAHVRSGATVQMPLVEALHRTLAEPVRCDVDYPPFDRSVMDGYAVRAADVVGATAPRAVRLRVVGRILAGSTVDRPLCTGEAMQINTGAAIPPGADAVVRVEDTEAVGSGDEVLIQKAVDRGHFITARATYVSAGEEVLSAGTLVTPLEVAVAATAGASRLTVYSRPTVAVLVTGDELIDIARRPTGAQIRNSNQYLLEGLILATHADPVVLGVVADDREAIRCKIEQGFRCGVLCITGGVSMGTSDFVPEVIESLGATIHIRKMAIKPGRPIHFATAPDGTLIFGLPGNPISTFVGFELLVGPALAALQGRQGVVPALVRALLRGPVGATTDRRTYRPARARVMDDGQWEVEPVSWHGSGDSIGIATVNALIMRPPRAPAVGAGDAVSILLLDPV
ncbi:MAG: molybdopterin molybdotransferase MoeA [Planctomycetota bacterium]|jgi:molybdopterin molybdotransferase